MDRSESVENACPLCHDPIHIFAVGPCDHPVCYRCSTRMRVLCEQMDCPICRSAMPQVVFVNERSPFKDINLRDCIPNRRNKIFYESEEIEDKYLDLLEFRCRHCPQRKPERTFAQLQTHMRREHQLFVCDICLAHLKIFPYETKFYDRKNLAVHRRLGDEDDKSYKGHPLCEFCDTRYLDQDELLKHLRKDHFFCHFCDQEGCNAYYNEYLDLSEHFRQSHFLCEEGECGNPSTRFTNAFSSEIDLKSHKATVHNNKSKETRTIDIDFQYAPRHQGYARGGAASDDYDDSGSHRYRHRGDRFGNRRRGQEDANLQKALKASLEESREPKARPPVAERVPDPIHDFPTLNGAPASGSDNVNQQRSTAVSKRVEDFPSLGATNVQEPSKKPQNPVSVNSKNAASSKRVEDFPSLGSANGQESSKKPQNPVPASSKNYASSITTFDSKPASKEKVKDPDAVNLVTLKAKGKTKEHWTQKAPNVTEDDYPSLGGSRNKTAAARPSSGAAPNSSSSWLQKTSVVEMSTSSTVTPSISVIAEKPSTAGAADPPKRRAPQEMRPISDDQEFPSLGGRGGASKSEIIPSQGSWTNYKASHSAKAVIPKSKKFDESFELPDSYNPAKQSESYQEKEKRRDDTNIGKGNKKNVVLNKKDFPSLVKKNSESSILDKGAVNKQVKKEASAANIEPKPSTAGGKKSKKPKKATVDKSLNDIAAGLMNANTVPTPGSLDKKAYIDENANSKISNTGYGLKSGQADHSSNSSSVSNKNRKEVLGVKEGFRNSNDFPSLHGMSSSVPKVNAPPGFKSGQLPLQPDNIPSVPPGFSKPALPPGLSKPVFSAHDYIQPPNFENRNKKLVQSIRSCLETVEDGFNNFKTFSFQFRQGMISANTYYLNCQLLIGESDFLKVFRELLGLLPDINKQQELWFEHQVVQSGRSSARSKGVDLKGMSPCSKCGQIVLKEDVQHHSLQHGDSMDFPSLHDMAFCNGSTASDHPSGGPKGAWIKAT